MSGTSVPVALHGQEAPPEIVELKRRVAVMRGGMAEITAVADMVAGAMLQDTTMRFLIPAHLDPGFFREFSVRAGGPPDTRDADDPLTRGVVLMPIRSWDTGTLGAAMRVESSHQLGRLVITIASRAGRPTLAVGDRILDNGATGAAGEFAELNGVANMIVAWTFYVEFVAAASRRGHESGIYLSDALPGGPSHNNRVHFWMPTSTKVPAIQAGELGLGYLASIDSMLDRSATPEHQAAVTRAADSLISWSSQGAKIMASSCGHYLLEELPRQRPGSSIVGVDWRYDIPERLKAVHANPGDAMLWFGYAGYDCPHAEVAQPFHDAGLRVVAVSDRLSDSLPPEVRSTVPLTWPKTDAVTVIPFPPRVVGPTSSIDMTVHYLWFKRLLDHRPGAVREERP